MFWGYGGTACHPLTQVQPFARDVIRKNGSIYLLMEPINSNADPDVVPATQYSEDGVSWQPIPEGINVTGSRYALVLDEIKPGDLEVSLDEFEVGVGPSRGKVASDYLQGRVDKACLVVAESPNRSFSPSSERKQIAFRAKVLSPYAVLLK